MLHTIGMPWYHEKEMFSTSLSLYKNNPPVTGGFPSQIASNVDLWLFLCY